MTPAPLALKFTARQLYKELLHLGRDYPDPKYPIAKKLHGCFSAFIGGDEARVREGIVKAEYIKKELEAMYYIKKYRSMKRAYHPDSEW